MLAISVPAPAVGELPLMAGEPLKREVGYIPKWVLRADTGDGLSKQLGNERMKFIYGECSGHHGFILIEEKFGLELYSESEAIKGCKTVGEARRLVPALKRTYVPGGYFEDDDGEPLPDDAPYDLSLVISLVPEISPLLEVVEDLLLFTGDGGRERLGSTVDGDGR